jgi:3-oxoacyl-[acyl-carrier protein] reductase
MANSTAMRFAGKRVIVTGGAGAIGGAIAQAFAAEGAKLALIDLRRSTLPSPTTKSAAAAFEFPADISLANELRQAAASAIEALGGVDILVNAAGVTSFGSAASLAETEWDRVLSINLKGVFLTCQSVIETMRRQNIGGRIVNIGSLLGKNGGNARPWLDPAEQLASGNVAYGVSKAGVHALTSYLARELASSRITVNAVAPGPIVSAMTDTFPERLRQLIPMGRMGTPLEVSAAVLFLASNEATFITGEVLDVNGGTWSD